ncbi:hypothetical protein TTHERM_00473160 (macronuclear) [Tetrahymena thermophila SB210]|uniref:Uncharacterized protein n=1 Tax=Tetrahymena thermophila (strain SB210) TaxID=312017 RepID=I7LX29_TETTS|nr:hypothetical protein TTHERM_00473160 [Tetrahymena thermophila SB210]EAS03654.2 hypothetical protein TTHERM_00473160 [Tetrahymena thermophila SB210]|eukprot:XP_001023899.2 hypothetical protein TTHERM_00473160 [Tetrahymena thermophila SB210]
MKQNLAIGPSGNIPLQQQPKKINISSNQGVSEAFQMKNFQLQDRSQQELGLPQDSKIKIQDQQKQRLENMLRKSQDEQQSIQLIQTVKTEEFEDDEPFQINLYSQKNFSLDRYQGESISNTQNSIQSNSINVDKKLHTQSSTQIQKQVIMEKNPQNKKDLTQSVQIDNKLVSNNLMKSQSPKEGLRYSKSFQNSQGGSSKHKMGNIQNEMYSGKQDSFSTSIQTASQTISNPSSLIDHYKLKYLQEVEKSLSSNNTNSQNSQASEDILTQKMQLIELKKKKIFQQANNEGKNLKIPLISQSLEFNNRYPTLKKNTKIQQGHKKRMSLREQTKRRKQFTDKKNVRLNKSMKASRLSTSFDLYCIYESKSEDSNDQSPQESRNRSFIFKSEKILNQLGLPSAPSSPTAEKQDEILDSSENNEEKLINTVPNSSRQQEKTEKFTNQTIQTSNFAKKNQSQKDETFKSGMEEQDSNNTYDNSTKTPVNTDLKSQIQTKGSEQFALKNSDSNSKLKKNVNNQSKTLQENQKSKINKNIPITKKSLELTSSQNKLTSPNTNQNQMTQSVVTTVQNRQSSSQTERKENLRSSQLSIKQEQNNKSNSDLMKDKGNTMTNSISLVKKEQLIVYDLKSHKVNNPEKQINQQIKQKEKVENGDISSNESSQKPKYEQDQINENDKSNKINITCQGAIEEEENIDGSPKGLNIINLYRKSNSQQDVPSLLENQSVENQQNLQMTNNQNSSNQNQYPFKKRNSSLTSFNSPQNANQQNFNIKFDNSSNLRNSMPKIPQVLPLTVSQFSSANKTKDIRFMTEEATPQQNQSNGNQQNSNQDDNLQVRISQSTNLNKEQQTLKNEAKEFPQMRDSQSFKYQSDRIQVIQFDKKQSRQNNQDGSKNSSLKGRRNSLNQISGQKLAIQSTQNSPQQGFNNNYPLNTLINQSNVSQILKKSESQAAFQNSTYRDQFKQKLELKSINQNQGYNLSIYIQNNLKQFANQNSQSPKGNRKGLENLESVGESQCNSPKDAKSEKLRSNISYSSINKSKAHSDLNSPEIKGQNQKLLESKKLKVVKVQPKTSQQSPAFKPQKVVTQQCNSELEVLDLKANINDMYYKKSIKPSPQRNQNLWSPESQGKQISQLDTQVSHLQSTKTNPDTDNSNIIDNSKQKKNVLVSEFYKDLSTPLFVQLGSSHVHVNLPQTLTQSAKNERYKNIKDEIERISSTNTSNLRREQMQLQNNQIMSPFWGQIDLKKQSEKKELVIKPLIQELSQQKQLQKKNKFNVESKVKSYIQAGQLNQAPNSKQKEQTNFHLAKGAGIISSSQQSNQQNSKSLHQESLDLGKQNKESQSMFTTYETFGQVNNNGKYTDNNQTNGNIDQTEKKIEYQSNSKYNTKNEVKQNNISVSGENQSKNIKSNQQNLGDQHSQLTPVEYLTQIQQQMQMQRQLANEQLQKAQQSINLIQQSIEIKNAIGSNYNTLIINGKQNNFQSQK